MNKMCTLCLFFIISSWTIYSECMPTGQSERAILPVNSCPRNLSEVEDATKRLNCSGIDIFENTYHCLPLSDLSQLIELCYQTSYLVQKGNCMVLHSGYLNNQSCLHFTEGCPKTYYQSKRMFEFPDCIQINKQDRCYLADPTCPTLSSDFISTTVTTKINVSLSITTSTSHEDISGDKDWIAIPVVICVLVIILIVSGSVWKRKCHRYSFKEKTGEDISCQSRNNSMNVQDAETESETAALIQNNENTQCIGDIDNVPMKNKPSQNSETEDSTQESNRKRVKGLPSNEGSTLNEDILKGWQEDNSRFVPTKASKFVEEKIKNQNLVTVVGNSGCGKTAIIQHIALKLKEEQGWVIKPVDDVKEIKEICSPGISPGTQTLFVLNDPVGKETLDEISYNSWKTYEKTLVTCLKRVKLLVSCRRSVISDTRVEGILKKESNMIGIDTDECRLSEEERREILNKYCQHMHLSEENIQEIIKTEAYFPLLCKLFSKESTYKKREISLFRYPFQIIKQEIEHLKELDKKKYCALIMVAVFNNNLNVGTIRDNDNSVQKYKDILGICELPENTKTPVIRSTLHKLEGCYVKCVGNAFQFLHDFIMEITTLVFGVDCPQETIQYADSGFLRRRVRIEDDTEEEDRDPFTVYLPEEYIDELVDRFIIDMQTEHIVDVLLNPSLGEKSVINSFNKKVYSLEKLLVKIKCVKDRLDFQKSFDNAFLTRLDFLYLQDEICPLVGLIVFCHSDISSFFIKSIPETKLKEHPIFTAICANGDVTVLSSLSKEYQKTAMVEIWKELLPIHVASVFHNFSIVEELVRLGADVNKFTTDDMWSPLLLAAANDEEHLKETGMDIKTGERRNKTIMCLLNYDANINLCDKDGVRPLFIACENGHESTVQLLLDNGADINLKDNDGTSPLWIACQNGHDSIVKLLLSKNIDINSCNKNGVSPLLIASYNGHESTVQLLLDNGADINLNDNDGDSPLWIACQEGHNSIAKLLLSKNIEINLCDKNGVSPLHKAVQNGHDSTVLLLLDNGADINLCSNNGISPLYIACVSGHESTVRILLDNNADIDLCDNDGDSPLYTACYNGHDGTVQLLLNNGANVNICNKNGESPLSIAKKNGHDIIFQLLVDKGASSIS